MASKTRTKKLGGILFLVFTVLSFLCLWNAWWGPMIISMLAMIVSVFVWAGGLGHLLRRNNSR